MSFLNNKGIAPIFVILIATVIYAAIIIIKNHLATAPIQNTNFTSPSNTPATSLAPLPSASPTAKPTLLASQGPTLQGRTLRSPTPQPVVTNNTPPGAGYSRQTVSVEGQSYTVDIIAADLNSTKVIVDTASDSDCSNNCPVLSLAEYVSRNGAYAGINGSFFCPAEYPSCAGKTNSFDTLLMNKSKHYFNSDNNVYSTIPAAIFSSGGSRFVGQSVEWGRDTSPDSVIANYPLLVSADRLNFTEAASEPKFGQKGSRDFIAAKGNMVYIGVIRGATMGEAAKILLGLGMRDALNLDEGGSTALYSGGYIAGPGRSIPNAVLFVRR